MDHVTIIIVNFNTAKDTRECLDSLVNLKHEDFDVTILVVDNGSKKVFTLPQHLIDKKIQVIRSESNLGFTGGNNLGISYSVKNFPTDYFFLLNSDTIVNSDTLQNLFLMLKNNSSAGIAVPKIYFYKNSEFHKRSYQKEERGNVIWFAGGTVDWRDLVAFHRGVDEVDRGQFDNLSQTDFATGCAMLIKREVIEMVGILDKKYFLYSEDVDYSLRTLSANKKIVFCPNSEVWHKNAGSSEGAGSRVQQYYQTRNRFLLTFNHGPTKSKILALKLLWQAFINGGTERQAALDFLLQRFGKQQII